MHYDLNICNKYKKFYEDVTETWERWKEKPESPEIRIGTLGEPTGHPEFLDLFDKIKPSEIITDGRILGTPGDPRRIDVLEKIIELKSKAVLMWSDSNFYRRSYHDLKSSDVDFKIGVRLEDFEKVWDENEKYLLIPNEDIVIPPDSLKDKENTEIITYYQNILLTDKKIIITKDSINLKPIKVYDRV